MTTTADAAPAKRLTPAGEPYPEREWTLPDLEKREALLAEARRVYHFNKARRAAEAGGIVYRAATTITLIALVDRLTAERDEALAAVGAARGIAMEERIALRHEVDLLKRRLSAVWRIAGGRGDDPEREAD